jgi:hypothetical protein
MLPMRATNEIVNKNLFGHLKVNEGVKRDEVPLIKHSPFPFKRGRGTQGDRVIKISLPQG